MTVRLLLQSVLNLAHSRCCSPMPAFRSLLPTCLAYLGHCPHFLLERWLLAHDPPGHLLLEGLEGIYLFICLLARLHKNQKADLDVTSWVGWPSAKDQSIRFLWRSSLPPTRPLSARGQSIEREPPCWHTGKQSAAYEQR